MDERYKLCNIDLGTQLVVIYDPVLKDNDFFDMDDIYFMIEPKDKYEKPMNWSFCSDFCGLLYGSYRIKYNSCPHIFELVCILLESYYVGRCNNTIYDDPNRVQISHIFRFIGNKMIENGHRKENFIMGLLSFCFDDIYKFSEWMEKRYRRVTCDINIIHPEYLFDIDYEYKYNHSLFEFLYRVDLCHCYKENGIVKYSTFKFGVINADVVNEYIEEIYPKYRKEKLFKQPSLERLRKTLQIRQLCRGEEIYYNWSIRDIYKHYWTHIGCMCKYNDRTNYLFAHKPNIIRINDEKKYQYMLIQLPLRDLNSNTIIERVKKSKSDIEQMVHWIAKTQWVEEEIRDDKAIDTVYIHCDIEAKRLSFKLRIETDILKTSNSKKLVGCESE